MEGAWYVFATASDATSDASHMWDSRMYHAACDAGMVALIGAQGEPWKVAKRAVRQAVAAAIAERG